jgi:long-chain acyl-CoA synthetase
MGAIDVLLSRLEEMPDKIAIYWQEKELTYREFVSSINDWGRRLDTDKIGFGDVCAFYGEFSPGTCALMFALMRRGAILAPLTGDVDAELPGLLKMSGAKLLYRFAADDSVTAEPQQECEIPPLIVEFKKRNHPGLLVFTSGSTGKPKGILQDVEYVSNKFVKVRKGWRTPLFLMMDHFGGFNTFLATFAYGGTAICLSGRDPESVAKTIQDSRENLLPTTPTFLNFLIMSKQYGVYDLSSIELITYGTEPMSETTLQKVEKIFPNARLKQTYGLSELGVLRSESKEDKSLWLKVGGDGFETKIIDDILWIRSEANMVGYLNAPNPFDEDGWMCTGDVVEEKDGYILFKGRKTEVINTGGKKVFPIEVESVLMTLPNIRDAAVEPRTHAIMGQVVQARVSLLEPEEPIALSERLRTECNKLLARYKVPVRYIIVDNNKIRNSRFKKVRANIS